MVEVEEVRNYMTVTFADRIESVYLSIYLSIYLSEVRESRMTATFLA